MGYAPLAQQGRLIGDLGADGLLPELLAQRCGSVDLRPEPLLLDGVSLQRQE